MMLSDSALQLVHLRSHDMQFNISSQVHVFATQDFPSPRTQTL